MPSRGYLRPMAGIGTLVSSRARAVSWTALYKCAMWLYGQGQQFWDNLTSC